MRVTMLGCGSSSGVPEIGCECAVCRSTDPRNARTRVSIAVEKEGKRLLIDTSPDLRFQAVRAGLSRIDAVLYTHDHADHIHGLDDVRAFNVRADSSITAYADAATCATLRARFPYAFLPKPEGVWYRPSLILNEISDDLSPFTVAGMEIIPILQEHARTTSLGFRIGNFAYSTDVNGFSEESFAKLENLDVWIVDCLRYTPSYTHSRLEITLQWIERLKPRRAILTHMAHDFDYQTLSQELPPGVEPGYDGLVIELP